MDPVLVGSLGIAVLFLLIVVGFPVAFTMMFVGSMGMLMLRGPAALNSIMGSTPYGNLSEGTLSVMPLFILMGDFIVKAGVGKELYRAGAVWLGHLPGGLALATIGACALFGACSGSSIATAATFGKIALPEMARHGYSKELSTGSVAVAGTLAMLIPPSMLMVMFAIITETSVGKLLIAGFIPGILSAILLMILVIVWVKMRPSAAPKLDIQITSRERIKSLPLIARPAIIVFGVTGTIYLGVGTPTEAAAIGTVFAFIFALFSRQFSWKIFKSIIMDTMSTTAMVLIIFVGAMMLTKFLAISTIPTLVTERIVGFNLSPNLFLWALVPLYVFLGCFIDALGFIVLTMPVIFPVVIQLGIDPILFGIYMVILAEVGLITPPFAMNIFTIKGVSPPGVSLNHIIRGVMPFLGVELIILALIIHLPQITLFLPNMMKQ